MEQVQKRTLYNEKPLQDSDNDSYLELQIRSQQRKEVELQKIRKAEQEQAARQRQFLEQERLNKENTLRELEESRKARALAQERLRARIENDQSLVEHEKREKEREAQRRIKALLSLKQNADSALSELKAANERRAQKEKKQSENRFQETVTLLSQGRNPYEHFRRREMEQKKQKELNRINVMAAKRRDDVRLLMAEDVRQYEKNQKRKKQLEEKIQQIENSAQYQQTRSPRTLTSAAKNLYNEENENENENEEDTKQIEKVSRVNTARKEVVLNVGEEDPERSESPPKKKFTLNLPRVASVRRSNAELNELQSALSIASLASTVISTRSSFYGDGEDNKYSSSSWGESFRSSVPLSRRDDITIRSERGDELKTTKKNRLTKPLSVLEQKMLERTMQSLKNNIVKKQVVMNKEFEGKSFITKPNVLLFDDFEIGCSYTKKVSVTNVSLSFNTFKVLELPARVSDFFKIAYAPPGRLSAGTGVNIEVTFTPVLPTPLSEKLVILAETGQFEIPIECTPKQCKVSLSVNQVEFDNISLGETQVKTIKVTNNGGLETNLELSFDYESFLLDSNPNTFVDSDGNTHSVSSTIQSSFLFNATPCVLKAYSCITFDITFTPKVLGTYSAAIVFVHKGTDNNRTETRLTLTGTVLDVPIYLSSREVDFHVCYCGQLYREVVVLHNRGKTALKATVKVPGLLKKYVEFVPRVAFVQAHSSLSVQLKFKPTIDLLSSSMAELMCSSSPTPTVDLMTIEDNTLLNNDSAGELDGNGTNVLNTLVIPEQTTNSTINNQPYCTISMAVTVEVASQCTPVWFQLKALVTHPALSILPSSFDFGECSINESVSIPFTVRNYSIVPVKYGFVRLPKEIQVYPSEGFGNLLPLEEMNMLVTFSPITATNHNFTLTVKTDQGKLITIPCNGTGVKPSLQFSPAIITLPPTSLGDVNSTSVFLENISKVPQVFEIGVPLDFPFLQVTPVVQTIQPGSRVHIKIDFEPGIGAAESISTEPIKSEDVQEEAKQNESASKMLKHRTNSRKNNSRSSSSVLHEPLTPSSELSHRSARGNSTDKRPRKKKADATDPDTLTPATPTAESILKSPQLLPQPKPFVALPEGKILTWKIPCFSKPAKPITSLKDTQQSNTGESSSLVYLEISATVAPPTLVRVLEPHERPANASSRPLFYNPPIDFGQVTVGQSVVKKLTIKNNSPNEIKPQLEAVYGTMTVLNAIRPMPPNQSQVLQIQYKPDTHGMHVETIEFTVGKHHRLVVPVQGQGVEPKLSLEPNDEVFDLGFTISKEFSKKELKLVNGSQFTVGYQIHLQRIGPKNLNGVNPFSVVPAEGEVPTGGEKIVTIFFEPDHENTTFHDVLEVEVKSESSKRKIILKGACTGTRGVYLIDNNNNNNNNNNFYNNNYNNINNSIISSVLKDANFIGMSDVIKPGYCGCLPKGTLTINFAHDSPLSSSLSQIVRTLSFGNAKIKREKGITADIVLEPLSPQAIKDGFSVDTLRLSIDADSSKNFTFKFDPSLSLPPLVSKKIFANNSYLVDSVPIETSVRCTVKGGYSSQDKEGVSFVILLIGHSRQKKNVL